MKPIISVENLSKQYHIGAKVPYKTFRETLMNAITSPARLFKGNGSRENNTIWALKDVSFEVQEGEVLGIIGRNGAGKTTLLKILSRVTEPTEGEVRIRGGVGSLLEVGTGFHPELTGRENIFLNGAILGMSKEEIKKKFDEIVAFAEIEKFLDTPVKRYSSGMYVRLAFAVAAHLEPEILIVDEVLAVGDAAFQKKCLGKMGEVAKEGRTVLFVSHNMLAVKNLCSGTIVLRQGQIVFSGNVSKAVDFYLQDKACDVGEVVWKNPETAPGNHQVRLKAIRIMSDGVITAKPPLNKDIEVQIDYWNFEKNGSRVLSIHIFNAMGVLLITSGNLKSTSLTYDPYPYDKYPVGLFRTTCIIPKLLLNNGIHYIKLWINQGMTSNIIVLDNVISFDAQESEEMRTEYTGEWLGVIRPMLAWNTKQLE